MCWEQEGVEEGSGIDSQNWKRRVSYWGERSVRRTAQGIEFQSMCHFHEIRSIQVGMILNLYWIPFLLISMAVTYGVSHSLFQVTQLYWLPIFNIAIYIILSRARKLPLNTVNSQVAFDLLDFLDSLSLGKYIKQTFSKEWAHWVLSSRHSFPLLNTPTGSYGTLVTLTLVGRCLWISGVPPCGCSAV